MGDRSITRVIDGNKRVARQKNDDRNIVRLKDGDKRNDCLKYDNIFSKVTAGDNRWVLTVCFDVRAIS